MLANYLIGLREGLEAALVVGILVAYLTKIGQRARVGAVWTGVGAAVGLSVGVAAALAITSSELSATAEEAFAGIVSLLAVAGVTWMIFWMKRVSRTLAGELRAQVDTAIATGAGALVALAFVAVAREGLETAIFVWSAAQATGSTATPVLGALLGLATAVALGYLLYKGSLRLNLATFFRWTGALLILVAAGVLMYAVHEFQELGWLPGEENLAFDVSSTIPPESWYGSLLKGAVGFTPAPSVLQALAWLAYTIPVAVLYFRPHRVSAAAPASAEESVPVSS